MTDDRAHLRRLWRHRGTTLPTPRRGPQQQLDLDEILTAASPLAHPAAQPAVSTKTLLKKNETTTQ
jgi:hypothetical protein